MTAQTPIRTPDQRLRVFVSSTLGELAAERAAVRRSIEQLRLVPVMFELGARPHPPRELYRAYLEQSQIFLGIYGERYGWVAPGETVSGLEDEFRGSGDRPRLLYIREPAPNREPELHRLLDEIKSDDRASYRRFTSTEELADLVQQDLAILLSERFEASHQPADRPTIPRPLTSIVGRDAELALLQDLLLAERLVTITGAGGIGKTRLALALAERVEDRFPDGAYVVQLAPIQEAHMVLPAVAARLGIRLDGTLDASEALVDHLSGRRLLLLLDNLEQVVDAAPAVVGLLEHAPGVHVVVTSRRPLRTAGEHVVPIEPLGLPARGSDAATIASSAAVQLFVQRARAANPAFQIDDANAAAVAELCERLDGLPLAIELAAARSRLLPPKALLRRLGDHPALLVGGSDRPTRQRTLAGMIDWSLRLLTPAQQALFGRLSVFRGGCTLSAAESVGAVDGQDDVLGALDALLDHGLVTISDDSGEAEPRVRMLETVRAEAAARLEARGESELMRRRHLDWFAALADRAQPFLCGPDQLLWFERIDPERANLRTAAATGLELGAIPAVLEMAWDLYIYYQLRGAFHEPAAWVRSVAARPDGLDARQRAVVTTALAIADLSTGQAPSAESELADALSTFTRESATFEVAVAQMHLGLCALESGRWAAAIEAERAATDAFAAVGHDWGVASSQNLLGVALAATGDRAAARASHERARDAGRRIANATVEAQAHTLLAALALDDAQHDLACRHLAQAVPLLDRARDAVGASGCLEVLAAAALAAQDPRTAMIALGVAEATRRRVGSPLNAVLRDRVQRLRLVVDERAGGTYSSDWRQVGGLDVFETLRSVAATVTVEGPPGAPGA